MARRRSSLSIRVVLATVLVASVAAALPEAAAQPSQLLGSPNVLIFITDDQPRSTLSVMPKTREYFVREGTWFKHAFPTNPMCCPARATLMTGRYTHNNGVKSNEDVHSLDMDTTLQRYLHDAGYYTGFYGKFMNRWQDDPPHFDRWSVIRGPYLYYDTVWNVDGEDQLVEGYWTDALAEHAGDFIEGREGPNDDQPWLLYVSNPAPHAPYKVAAEYQGTSVPQWHNDPAVPERNKSDKPSYVRNASVRSREAKRVARRQMRMLKSVDDLVGDVMTTLDELDETNTIAFFVSDNGYLWGQHGLLGAGLSKGNPYARSVKVPMMMRWPDELPRGHVDRRLVGFIDIAPTIYSATGVAPDPTVPLDGRSLLEDWGRRRILNESWRVSDASPALPPDWAALRTKRLNYVEYFVGGNIVFREYYDLRADPNELHNLLGDRSRSNDPKARRLHRLLKRARSCSGESCP